MTEVAEPKLLACNDWLHGTGPSCSTPIYRLAEGGANVASADVGSPCLVCGVQFSVCSLQPSVTVAQVATYSLKLIGLYELIK